MDSTKELTWFFDYLEYKINNSWNYIPTGFRSLDNLIDGFQKGVLSIIGARPGTGKTTFIINTLKNLKTTKSLVFTTEVSKEKFLEKFISVVCNIEHKKIKHLENGFGDINNFKPLLKEIGNYNIVLNDETKPSILTIRNNIEQFKPDIVFFDYFQNIQINPLNVSSYHEYTRKVEQFIEIAKIFNVPFVVTSQLKRLTDTDKPVLSDLKETGKLEEAASLVILMRQDAGDLVVDIAKNRDGSTGEVRFKGDWGKNRLYE